MSKLIKKWWKIPSFFDYINLGERDSLSHTRPANHHTLSNKETQRVREFITFPRISDFLYTDSWDISSWKVFQGIILSAFPQDRGISGHSWSTWGSQSSCLLIMSVILSANHVIISPPGSEGRAPRRSFVRAFWFEFVLSNLKLILLLAIFIFWVFWLAVGQVFIQGKVGLLEKSF